MKSIVEDWDALAAWFDEKQGDVGDLWHRALIHPCLLQVLGPIESAKVLDLGCGNGSLSRQLARRGAQVTGVDASAAIIHRARERESRAPLGIAYHVADAARLSMLPDASFDVVVSCMALMDIADAHGALQEAGRVLRPRGRFVASLCHPCFDIGNDSAWALERVGYDTTVYRKVSRYTEPREQTIPWRIAPGQFLDTRSYHRPLSWYFRTLRAAGFVITAFEEPEPTEEFLREETQGPWMAQVPLHCVFEAVKM